MDNNDCDFGGAAVHPFGVTKYIALEAGKPVIMALVERKPFLVYWQEDGTGRGRGWTRDRAKGEAAGWQEHRVFAVVVQTPDGFARGKLDSKGRLAYALRMFAAAGKVHGRWITVNRSGAGTSTEYAIAYVERPTPDMVDCVKDTIEYLENAGS